MCRYLIWAFVVLCTWMPTVQAVEPLPLKREFRGVWVATVANIDWPSKPGLPVAMQKAELLAILDKAKDLNMNAIVFQVRPMADALYVSKLEPWSEYLTGAIGKAPVPLWDPLRFLVTQAHARGLELHAWFNPFRARHPSAKSPAPKEHITRRRPDLAKPYGIQEWMNPTNPDVQNHAIRVILDVVRRYDVDGIHVDDYFYPYPEKDKRGKEIPFPDEDTWDEYQKTGGKLSRGDWRRQAVNTFIERMYKDVKQVKPWVKVGVSPFGIWKPGHPPGIIGFNQYEGLYADAKLWLNEGWSDYFTPHLYWPIAQEKQSFPKLLDWWAGENTKKRHLWPGVFTGRVTDDPKSWPAKEIADQIEITRNCFKMPGVVHFSMRSLLKNTGGVADVVKEVYAEPALVPEMPWLATGEAPAKPAVVVDEGKLKVKVAAGTRFVVLRAQNDGAWRTRILAPGRNGLLDVPLAGAERVIVSVVDRIGRESERVDVIR